MLRRIIFINHLIQILGVTLVDDDKIEEFKSDAWYFIRKENLVK